jgi:hypothetical protein
MQKPMFIHIIHVFTAEMKEINKERTIIHLSKIGNSENQHNGEALTKEKGDCLPFGKMLNIHFKKLPWRYRSYKWCFQNSHIIILVLIHRSIGY